MKSLPLSSVHMEVEDDGERKRNHRIRPRVS